MRDETDLSGLKLTIDLKRGVDPDKLMQKLFKLTPLEDSFSLQLQHPHRRDAPGAGSARSCWRSGSPGARSASRRRIYFDPCSKKQEKLHLLQGLKRILLDIDKAIAHRPGDGGGGRGGPQPDDRLRHRRDPGGIRGGDQAAPPQPGVHPQAHRRRSETLEEEIARPGGHPAKPQARVEEIIIEELDGRWRKKYGQPRRTDDPLRRRGGGVSARRRRCPTILCTCSCHREGYFKKITPQSLRMSGEQKLQGGRRRRPAGWRPPIPPSCCSSPTSARSTRPGLSDFGDTKA